MTIIATQVVSVGILAMALILYLSDFKASHSEVLLSRYLTVFLIPLLIVFAFIVIFAYFKLS